MSTVPILNGQQPHPVAKGTLNATMVARTTAHLEALGQSVRVTRIEEGYDVDAQIASHPWAETVIMQFPVNWIGVPWPFKKCVDEVHTAGLDGRLCEGDGRTAEAPKANCGLGGTLTGRHSMPSVTLSAPEAAFASPQEPFFEGRGLDDLLWPMHLYTAATMKGYKPVILLEEAGVDYDLTFADFAKTEQKAPGYMKLNPNGRIPTILDRANGDCAVFESGAILLYLAEKYGRFLPADAKTRPETLQRLMFQMGGIGPMMGQALFFQRIAAPHGHDEPVSIKRCMGETQRLLEVLDTRLAGTDWLAGGEHTIAHMAT